MVEKDIKNKCNDKYNIIVIIFCILFLITIILIEVKDWTHDYRYQIDYGTQNELEAINWSGNINDLRYCHIFFYVTLNHSVEDYSFAWNYDCQSIKDSCEKYSNDCYFDVQSNIVGEYGKNKLYQYFDGRCYCHINRDYINTKLDR